MNNTQEHFEFRRTGKQLRTVSQSELRALSNFLFLIYFVSITLPAWTSPENVESLTGEGCLFKYRYPW